MINHDKAAAAHFAARRLASARYLSGRLSEVFACAAQISDDVRQKFLDVQVELALPS